MNRHLSPLIGMFAALALVVTACGEYSERTTNDVGAASLADDEADTGLESFRLRLSTASVPEDHHTMAMYEFAERVERRTGGRVTAVVHHSSSLMDQTTEQNAIQRGNVDIVYTSSHWLEELVPEAGVVGVPYLIQDVDHLYAVHDGEIGEQLYEIVIAKLGIRPLTSLYLGTRQLNLTDVGRIEKPGDLAGVNLRVPDAQAWTDMGRALGANPTPVAFGELYLALETGTVDGQDNPLPTTMNAAFYEVTDQIVLTGHLVDDLWPTINEELWQSMDVEAQDAIRESWIEARQFGTEIALGKEADAVAIMEEAGLEVYEPDVEAFRKHILSIYLEDEVRSGQWPDGMVEAIQALADDPRGGRGEGTEHRH